MSTVRSFTTHTSLEESKVMAKGQKKDDVFYRSVKFEIIPTVEQEQTLWQISNNLREVWNQAVRQRQTVYEQHLKPIYDKIAEAKKQAESAGYRAIWESKARRALNAKAKESNVPMIFVSAREQLLATLAEAFKVHAVTLYDQINALTNLRGTNPSYAAIPRNWQEETLDTVNAGYTSFMVLRKNGDPDARPPRLHENMDFFSEIPGRSGFSIKSSAFEIRCGKLSTESLAFPIPQYQQEQIAKWSRVKKFTLFRDQKDKRKAGRFWVALSGEVEKPETTTSQPNALIFIAPGTTTIGVCSSRSKFLIKLWRPDKYWKPKIDDVDRRLKKCAKGSRKYQKLAEARQRMFAIMSRQQKAKPP